MLRRLDKQTGGKQRQPLKSAYPAWLWPYIYMDIYMCVCVPSTGHLLCFPAQCQAHGWDISGLTSTPGEVGGSWECYTPASGRFLLPHVHVSAQTVRNRLRVAWGPDIQKQGLPSQPGNSTLTVKQWALHGVLFVHDNVCQRLVAEGIAAVNWPAHFPASRWAHQSTQNCPGVHPVKVMWGIPLETVCRLGAMATHKCRLGVASAWGLVLPLIFTF